jgi:uncharacterized protein Yka (UPF0111/DUF47 family)
MDNHKLQRIAENLKSETNSVIDDLIQYIEELEQDVDAKNGKIQELESEIDDLKSKLNDNDI